MKQQLQACQRWQMIATCMPLLATFVLAACQGMGNCGIIRLGDEAQATSTGRQGVHLPIIATRADRYTDRPAWPMTKTK